MLRKPAMGASFSRSGQLDLHDPGRLAREPLADGLQQVILKPLYLGGHLRPLVCGDLGNEGVALF
jgi:hypothetical protein